MYYRLQYVIILGRATKATEHFAVPTIVHHAIEHRMSAIRFKQLLELMKEFNLDHMSKFFMYCNNNSIVCFNYSNIICYYYRLLKAKNPNGKTALLMSLEYKLLQHAEHLIDLIHPERKPGFF